MVTNTGVPFLSHSTVSIRRKEFVDAYIDYVFNKSVEQVFAEFKRGFFKVCNREIVEMFQPDELRGMMVGQEITDWNEMKQVSTMHTPHSMLSR